MSFNSKVKQQNRRSQNLAFRRLGRRIFNFISFAVTAEKTTSDEEDANAENDSELNEKLSDGDPRKTIKVKPFGGPLLAQVEISTSQQNFFKILDEKIESGPDYDSASEAEKAAEQLRIRALMKDWETASAGSRSLPSTPSHRKLKPGDKPRTTDGIRNGNGMSRSVDPNRVMERSHSQISTNSLHHQSYGVSQTQYRQPTYNPDMYNQPNSASYSSAMQYQALSPMYITQSTYQPPPKLYPSYNQHGSPIKMVYQNNSMKHIPYEQPPLVAAYSPTHKVYGPGVKNNVNYSNGEYLVQQQMYNQQVQYQQSREYQQYRQTKEQMLIQKQGYQSSRSYQNSVHIPIVMNSPQTDVSPLHRKQYELT